MTPLVFVTRRIPAEGIRILKEKFRVAVYPHGRPISRQELEEGASGADGLLCLLTDRIDGPLLDRAPRLQVVANLAVGTDNIDIAACTARGVAVTNTPGALTDATADLTFALLLAVARRVVEGDRFMREGRFSGWDPLLLVGAALTGKILGIVGLGRIGQAVARRAAGFGLRALYHNRRPLPRDIERVLGTRYVSLEELLRESDFVTLHLPYSPEVHHLINASRLRLMKPTAYLVNTARGALVDEKALVECLRERRIAGAALDVFEHEPDVAPGLVELDNAVLVPHLGSAVREVRAAMAEMAARSVAAVLEGCRPAHLVNPEVWEVCRC